MRAMASCKAASEEDGARLRPTVKARFIWAVSMLVACPALMFAFSSRPDVFFPAYRGFSKGLLGILATVASIVPFAVWDIVILLLIVATLVQVVRCVRGRQRILPWLSTLAVVLSAGCLVSVGGWALNHYAPPLANDLGLEIEGGTVDELYEVTAYHLEQAARLAWEVPRDDSLDLEKQDFYELARIAGAAYEKPSEDYAVFTGSDKPVKSLLLWGEPLLYSGHTGLFFAATAESGVPLNCAVSDQPFVMCHEAAHRLGLAGEAEANFAAYVACVSSDDVRFEYSGHYKAFVYCYNKLRSASPDRARQLFDEITKEGLGDGLSLVRRDMKATSAHYDTYEGTFEKVGTAVNDTYLKSFGETEGVQSYGFVVNYLLAWHEAGRDTQGV